jgi:TRAP-type C4-dicarboxylate transport system permease large subunit
VRDVKVVDYTKAVLPLRAVEIGAPILLILVPPIVLTLPQWAFGPGR